MNKGAYVLIFFFWALLSIITPTLVQWSAAAAQSKEETMIGKGYSSEEGSIFPRKLMKLTQEIQRMKKAPARPPPAPAPTPAPQEGVEVWRKQRKR